MIRVGRFLLCGTMSVGLCAGAYALTAENPYKAITERNVFGLKDPPPPPPPVDLTKSQPSKLMVTGMTDILGNKRVLLKSAAGAPSKPGQPPMAEKSYMLTVGQREDDIEILDIDMLAGSVKLNNAGEVVTLTIEKDGPKLASTPAPAVTPGMPGLPGAPGVQPVPRLPTGLVPPPPTGSPSGANPAINNPFIRSIPTTTRSLRVPETTSTTSGAPGYGAYANPSMGYNPAAGTTVTPGQTGGAALPGLLGPSIPVSQTKWPPEQNMSREEQAVMMELQREQLRAAGNNAWKMLPSTGLEQTPQPQQPAQQTPPNNFPPLPPGTPQF